MTILDKVVWFGAMILLILCNVVLIVRNRRSRANSARSAGKRPVQKLTLIAIGVTIVFVISVLPYMVMKMTFLVDPAMLGYPVSRWVRAWIITSYFLMHVSSMVNPLLYVLPGCVPTKIPLLFLSLQISSTLEGPNGVYYRKRNNAHSAHSVTMTCGGSQTPSKSLH